MITQPKYFIEKFTCPNCGVFAKQNWWNYTKLSSVANELYTHAFLNYRRTLQSYQQEAIEHFLNHMNSKSEYLLQHFIPPKLSYAICQSCEQVSLWIDKKLVYPNTTSIELPNPDLNDDIKKLYNEAAIILIDSPKGAAAILRLSVQKLLVQIGKSGKNINDDIKELVSEGLSPKIQKALDLLRVVGNNSVHPGQINLEDDTDLAMKLFRVLNLIADEMITRPKELNNLYDTVIPDETKKHIENRDNK